VTIKSIKVDLVVNADGTMQDPGPIPVPYQQKPVEIVWSLSATGQDVVTWGDPGIQLGPFAPPPGFVVRDGLPEWQESENTYRVMIFNDNHSVGDQTTVGKYKYTINYIWNDNPLSRDIQNRVKDPTIDNQPPPPEG